MTLRFHLRVSVLLVSVTLMLLLSPAAAPGTALAATAPSSPITDYLADHPRGLPISDNEISYDNGQFVVTLAPPRGSVQGVPDCPSGWYCFYERENFGYPRGKLSSCGAQSLSNWGWDYRIESVHYNLWSGQAIFYERGIELFRVSPGLRALSWLSDPDSATVASRLC